MDFESAVNDDRAVSPVIGVILMVAITVILAAVIGTFVIGLGNQTGGDTPRASFDTSVGNGGDTVTITHETGDTIDAENLRITSSVDFDQGSPDSVMWSDISAGEVTAGSSVDISRTGGFSGETVRVVYVSPDSDSTTTLMKKEIS